MPNCYYDEEGRLRSTLGGNLAYGQWTSKDPYHNIGKYRKKPNRKKKLKNSRQSQKFSKNRYKIGSSIFPTVCTCSSCNKKEIFFCNCDNGGRVFFETLYPEWKKHDCSCFNNEKKVVSKDNDDYYEVLFPSKYNAEEEVLEYRNTPCLDDFHLKIRNKYIFNNATKNVTLLHKYKGGQIYLKVILSSKKFLNQILVDDAIFNTQVEFEKFLIYIFTKTDLSLNKEFDIFYNTIPT